MARTYAPRRAGSRWLEGAPPCILDCFDHPHVADRYTIIFGGPEWTEGDCTYSGARLHYLGCGPGFSQWGEFSVLEARIWRYRQQHRRIRWRDIPKETRRHIVARAAEAT